MDVSHAIETEGRRCCLKIRITSHRLRQKPKMTQRWLNKKEAIPDFIGIETRICGHPFPVFNVQTPLAVSNNFLASNTAFSEGAR